MFNQNLIPMSRFKLNGVDTIISSVPQPTPKRGQVWLSVQSGSKFVLINHDQYSGMFLGEDGSKPKIGFGWLDGYAYICIGTIKL